MLLQVPFYKNLGDVNNCGQACMQSVLKYYTGRFYSLKKLNELTGRRRGFWTWTTQEVAVLHGLGLNVRYYSTGNPKDFLAGRPFFLKYFGKNAAKILKYTDLAVVMKSIKKTLKLGLFEKKKLTLLEIKRHLAANRLMIFTLDWNVIINKKKPYSGHAVVLTGITPHFVYCHDSGPDHPTPNKKISQRRFSRAWNAPGTDNDVIVVWGKCNDIW